MLQIFASQPGIEVHRIMCLKQRPHYPGEVRKRSFISTVRPTIHTNPLRKRSFVSTVRPTVHTTPSRRRSSSKRSSNPRNLKTPTLRFRVNGKHFENDGVTKIMWFPCPNFPQTQIQNGPFCCIFQ